MIVNPPNFSREKAEREKQHPALISKANGGSEGCGPASLAPGPGH
jgi:hypothetical protein